MESIPLPDRAGRRRSPATTSSFHQGLPPRNKGRRYPPRPAERGGDHRGDARCRRRSATGCRLRGVIVVLWRAGLRISEALALNETDLDPDRGARARPPRQGRQAPRGRNGPLGVGAPRRRGSQLRTVCRSARCSACVRGPTRGRPCAPAGSASNSTTPRSPPVCVAGSRRTNMPTRWLS